jgi:cbb3-type cytochrome oxidase subunit 3
MRNKRAHAIVQEIIPLIILIAIGLVFIAGIFYIIMMNY